MRGTLIDPAHQSVNVAGILRVSSATRAKRCSGTSLTSHRVYLPQGFTLVELLVVIAIIGILVATTIAGHPVAQETAQQSQCSNNLHQLATACINYEATKKEFPFGRHSGTAVNPDGSTSTITQWGHLAYILQYTEGRCYLSDDRFPE